MHIIMKHPNCLKSDNLKNDHKIRIIDYLGLLLGMEQQHEVSHDDDDDAAASNGVSVNC